MSPSSIDDVNAPRSDKNIVLQVMEYVDQHVPLCDQQKFKSYDDALHVIWPGLFKSDPHAALKVSIAIFLDAAERKGFTVLPTQLKELKF